MLDLGACYFYFKIKVIRDCPQRSLQLLQTAYLQKVL